MTPETKALRELLRALKHYRERANIWQRYNTGVWGPRQRSAFEKLEAAEKRLEVAEEHAERLLS